MRGQGRADLDSNIINIPTELVPQCYSERVVEYYGMELCQNIRAQQSTDINLDWIHIIFVRAHIPGTAVYSTQKCTFNLTRCRLAACRREAAHFGVGGSASAKQTRVPLMSKAKRTERGGKRG